MKKFLKIFLGILFLALLVGTFVFLWNKTRPVKVVYTLATPVHERQCTTITEWRLYLGISRNRYLLKLHGKPCRIYK